MPVKRLASSTSSGTLCTPIHQTAPHAPHPFPPADCQPFACATTSIHLNTQTTLLIILIYLPRNNSEPYAPQRLSLILSPPIPLRLYTLPYWSNPPFLIFDIRTLRRSGLSARAPECQQEALLLQRNRATRYVSWNIMAVFWLSYWQEALLIQRNHASTLSVEIV